MSEKESVKSLIAISGLEAAAILMAQVYAQAEGTQRLEVGIKLDDVLESMSTATKEYLYPFQRTMTI